MRYRLFKYCALIIWLVMLLNLSGCAIELADIGLEEGGIAADADAGAAARSASGFEGFSDIRFESSDFEPGEISTLHMEGIGTDTSLADSFIMSRSLTQSQLTTLLLNDMQAFDELGVGDRVYASIQNNEQIEAGWLQKAGRSRVYFNDGIHDLIRSDINGDTITHYIVRSGRDVPFARTVITDGGTRFNYSIRLPHQSGYVDTGYGILSRSRLTLDIYDINNQYKGTLYLSKLRYMEPSQLPYPSIATHNGIRELGSTPILALIGTFHSASSYSHNNNCTNNQNTFNNCMFKYNEILHVPNRNIQYRILLSNNMDIISRLRYQSTYPQQRHQYWHYQPYLHNYSSTPPGHHYQHYYGTDNYRIYHQYPGRYNNYPQQERQYWHYQPYLHNYGSAPPSYYYRYHHEQNYYGSRRHYYRRYDGYPRQRRQYWSNQSYLHTR